jgi:hypothetical protein
MRPKNIRIRRIRMRIQIRNTGQKVNGCVELLLLIKVLQRYSFRPFSDQRFNIDPYVFLAFNFPKVHSNEPSKQCCGYGSVSFGLPGSRSEFFHHQARLEKNLYFYSSVTSFYLRRVMIMSVFRIRIHFLRIRIRIQRLRLETNTDPDTDRIQYGSRALMTKN